MTIIANKKFSGNEDSRVDSVRPRDFAPKKFGKNNSVRRFQISLNATLLVGINFISVS